MSEVNTWVGITGSWRVNPPKLKIDLEREVTAALHAGKGIVSGGALGVDYDAAAISLQAYPDGSRIRVLLPTSLDIYATHYRKRANEGTITHRQAEKLIRQLNVVDDLGVLIVNSGNTAVNKETYYQRNGWVVDLSDELLAFQVNNSAGTQDTINKACLKKIPVRVFEYHVT